jgi:amidohydrolase
MPNKEDLKSKVCLEIDRRSEEIVGLAKAIWQNPELGFKEAKTSRLVAEKLAELGIPYHEGLGITGVKGVVKGGSKGPTVAVLGELDAVRVPAHPEADPESGAVHACGHHCQVAQAIGVAIGITGAGILPSLSGSMAFIAVPPEEDLEFEYREDLRRSGKLSYWAGKHELIKLGEFDDVDIAIMTHGMTNTAGKLGLGGTGNGSLFKYVEFFGQGGKFESAGAGTGAQGVNAQSAARVAISAIDTQRETFKSEDNVVVKTLITRGGEAVCNIPAESHMEIVIQGKSLEAIKDAEAKVDRSLRAGAIAVGGRARVTTLPGYLPLRRDPMMQEIGRATCRERVWLLV